MQALAPYLSILGAGGEVVTATGRQARALQAALGRHAAATGAGVWRTPRIVPYSAWLERALGTLDDRPQLIAGYAAERLWQLVVAESRYGETLVSGRPTAAGAAAAWALAQEWQIDLARLPSSTVEESAFLEWASVYAARTALGGMLDLARLPALVAARVPGAGGEGPVGFHGFATRTPARATLIAALEGAGRPVVDLVLEAGVSAEVSLEAVTPEVECEAIVAWARRRLQADASARLVVMLPDLQAHGALLRRRLDDALSPAVLSLGAGEGRAYAFATVTRLADYAVVESALALLGLGSATLDLLDLGRLLRSPYVPGGERCLSERAVIDAELRQAGARTLVTEDLLRRLRAGSPAAVSLATLISAVRAPLIGGGRRTPGEWADAMQRALRASGWPQGRTLGAGEYQAARAFNDALAALGGLSTLLSALPFEAARSELRALVAATPCQTDPADPPVLVLDRHEDAAVPCDGLWVAGLTADRFPAAARPNPFLPLALQRARGISQALASGPLDEARQMLAAWRRSAPDLVLSAPQRNGDTGLVRSLLIPPAVAPVAVRPERSRAEELRAAQVLDRWVPGRLPPVAAGSHVAGGVRVLELQSACAFRAAAELRLRARPLPTPVTGLPRALRGTLAHAALAFFWGEVGSHAGLERLSAADVEQVARRHVDRAFADQEPDLPRSRLVDLERDWLTRAIAHVAEIERAREPFVVIAREQQHVLRPGGFELHTRMDRVDRLEDGTTVVIDYKTGTAQPRRWAGPRPDQMQLPLYAAFQAPPPAAVALLFLPVAKAGFCGWSQRAQMLPKVRVLATARQPLLRSLEWPELLAEWQRASIALIEAYAGGEAFVDPAPQACEQCGLSGLCRIPASGVVEEEEDPEIDAEGSGQHD